MVYKDAYSLAQDMLREAGYRADPLSVGELEKLGEKSQFVPPKQEKTKGCTEEQKAGVVPGGHCTNHVRTSNHK